MNPIVKQREQPKSLRAAINAFCFNCMGGTEEDQFVPKEVRMNVNQCTSKDCPLFAHRPWKRVKR